MQKAHQIRNLILLQWFRIGAGVTTHKWLQTGRIGALLELNFGAYSFEAALDVFRLFFRN